MLKPINDFLAQEGPRNLVHVGSPGYFLLEHFMTAHHEITTPFRCCLVIQPTIKPLTKDPPKKKLPLGWSPFYQREGREKISIPNNSQEHSYQPIGDITP